MTIGDIISMISSVGFPIVCCLYLIYSNGKNGEKHDAELEKMRTAVDNNTKVMLKLCARMGVDADD